MNFLNNHTPFKLLLISLIGTVFILYTDLVCVPWFLNVLDGTERQAYLWAMLFRSGYFFALIFFLIKFNLRRIHTTSFLKRMFYNALFFPLAAGICLWISFLLYPKSAHFGISIQLFQFFVACVLSALIGHIFLLYSVQRKKEQEIEQLKIENLQSRYDALTNQINPHFFFNSLNGLTALIRKKNDENTLAYVNKLSDVFRYILQSNKKGLVTLKEELDFAQSFRYMMEVRFANKLKFDIDINPDMLNLRLPFLSILPLIENVTTHNIIDSGHKMVVTIRLNEKKELIVFNPVYPKLSLSETNGTGLKNLKNRFLLLMNKEVRVEIVEDVFYVYLPLI